MEPIREDDEKLVMTGIPVTDFLSRKVGVIISFL